jgi:predicted transcriptional regulator
MNARSVVLSHVATSFACQATLFDEVPTMRYHCTVNAVKILLREDVLAELDGTADVREKGRSAVLRQLVSDFLRQRRETEIDAQYECAYKETASPLGEEFAGWEDASSDEQIRQIEDGLREADAGDFASDEEVAAVFEHGSTATQPVGLG